MIHSLMRVYYLVLIADAVFSYMPEYDRVPWRQTLKKVADFTLNPIRKSLPPDLPLDPSAAIVIFLSELFIYLF